MKTTRPSTLRYLALACALLLYFTFVIGANADHDHTLLDDMGEGPCTSLTGDVRLVAVFTDVDSEVWTRSEALAIMEQVNLAVNTLQREAASYGTQLSIQVEYHTSYEDLPPQMDESEDWVENVLDCAEGLSARTEWRAWVDTPLLFFVKTGGRAFAHSESSDSEAEFAILYNGDGAATIRHELLHLYGASDYYIHEDVKAAAQKYIPDSIMLTAASDGVTDSLTAYVIGWTDKLDSTANKLIQATADVTSGDYSDALDENTLTGLGATSSDGVTYSGMLVNGSRHGWGQLEYANGDAYLGDWVWGARTGTGEYTWANGDTYTGDFVNSQQTGCGVSTWISGNSYTGDHVNSRRNGEGTFVWASGATYSGAYVDNVFHGFGVYTWSDGSSYAGNFVNGQREGYGVYHDANGHIMQGQWRNGDFID